MSEYNITEAELRSELERVLGGNITQTEQQRNSITVSEMARILHKSPRTIRDMLHGAIENGVVERLSKRVNGRIIASYLPKGKTSWIQPRDKKSNVEILSAMQTANTTNRTHSRVTAENTKHSKSSKSSSR